MPKYFITTQMCIDWIDKNLLDYYFYRCLMTDKTPKLDAIKITMFVELRNDLMNKYNIEKDKRYIDIDSSTYIDKTIIESHLLNQYRIYLRKLVNKIASI